MCVSDRFVWPDAFAVLGPLERAALESIPTRARLLTIRRSILAKLPRNHRNPSADQKL